MILECAVKNDHVDTLSWALPDAEFVERHSIDVPADSAAVWRALHEVRWSDLRLSAPFMLARGLRPDHRKLLEDGPVDLLTVRPPTYLAGAKVGRPWQPRPEPGPELDSLAAVREFDQPGWLKYGMDFTLEERSPGLTTVTTWTRCEPTDDRARRRFRPYWWLIRPFSGLIRRELLAAACRRAQAS